MEQRDYLKRQIDQLGMVLAQILSDLLGLKSQGQFAEIVEESGRILKNELGYSFNDMLALPNEGFIENLQKNKKINLENFSYLAEILLTLADELNNEHPGNEKSKNYYEKCLKIYEFLNDTDLTYSYDRRLKIDRLKALT